MVLPRSDPNTAYRQSADVPETPLTPRTPLSPPRHRSRLLSPTLSRPSATRSSRKRERTEDDDLDLDLDLDRDPAHGPSNAARQPSQPTPSELLSMDLNTLALHRSSGSVLGTPSARLSDDAIAHLHLSLPFEKFLASSSSSSSCPSPSLLASGIGSLESVHRYPNRSPIRASNKNAQSTPTKTRSILNKIATPPSPAISQRSALVSPPRSSNRGQFMTDEENNLFLTRSPRAIRTPRKSHGRTDQSSPALWPESPVPAPNLAMVFAEQDIEAGSSSSFRALNESLYVDEDDRAETESVQSPARGDLEKENHTPKMSEDFANPFCVGGPSLSELKRSTRSTSKAEGPTTPTGPSGSMIRSKRQALGSISPWRWNTFNEQAALSFFSGTKGVKGLGLIDATSSPCSKAGYTVSDWVESADQQKSAAMSSDTAETSAGSSSSSSSSSIPKSHQAAGAKSLSSSSSSSTTSLLGPALGAKGASAKVPDDHPNSVESAERKGGPSSLVAKLTESVIQPHAVAFNRRAQQVAGQIYYWKHGSYQLVSEQDKQQWPGEWKFEIYQDPQSPGGPSQSESSLAGNTGAAYTGKGKLTDRQLSGPKRLRTHREPLGGLSDMSGSSAPLHHDRELSGEVGAVLDREETPPPSPSHRASMMRQETGQLPKQSRLQDRYDFRERRMLDEPLTPRSRRCGA